MTTGRIVIIPFLHGKLGPDGTLIEPDIDAILEKWLERHPEFRGRKFHTIKTGGDETCLVRVTADFSPDLADYDPAEDADLVRWRFSPRARAHLQNSRRSGSSSARRPNRSRASSAPSRPLTTSSGRSSSTSSKPPKPTPASGTRFPHSWPRSRRSSSLGSWPRYLETARETEPFDPALFEDDDETEPEEVEDMRRDDIRQCTRDLLLVERAREWLLGDGESSS